MDDICEFYRCLEYRFDFILGSFIGVLLITEA
jgi:hypothetical protein